MDGKILVLAGRAQFVYEVLEFPTDEDDDKLIDDLNEFVGVAYASRQYGEYSLLITLDDAPKQEQAETGARLMEFATLLGYRLRQIITIG
jgi:hypothetical protein